MAATLPVSLSWRAAIGQPFVQTRRPACPWRVAAESGLSAAALRRAIPAPLSARTHAARCRPMSKKPAASPTACACAISAAARYSASPANWAVGSPAVV